MSGTDHSYPFAVRGAQKRGLLERLRGRLLTADPQRLINYGRIITAAFAIIAIYLDPTQPAQYRDQAQYVLMLYAVLALIIPILPLRLSFDSPVHFVFHLMDTLVLAWLAFLTNELTSPFFSFVPFTLLAMTMRWGFRGTILGALMVETMLLAIGVPDILDGVSELNFLIIRATYFLLSATMLGYFGAYRESSRARLTRLANWSIDPIAGDRKAWLANLCNHAADVMGCRELLVIWRDQDRPVGGFVDWRDGDLRVVECDDAGLLQKLDDRWLADMAGGRAREFRVADAEVLTGAMASLSLPQPQPENFAVCAGYSGIRFFGSICVIDPDCRPEDALGLTEIIAKRIGAELERLDFIVRSVDVARVEERGRLARDLHDSVLQDLTAASLKLRTLSSSVDGAAPQLRDLETIVVEQQRRIRRFVEEQRDETADAQIDVCSQIRRQTELLEQKWGVSLSFGWQGPYVQLASGLVDEIMQLISEATSNAVRHGRATAIGVQVKMLFGRLEMDVIDNGRGLDWNVPQPGSASLRARVTKLGGAMSVEPHAPGLKVKMIIPVEETWT